MAAELPPLVARVFCYKALSSALRALGGGALLEEGGVLPIADEVAAAVAVACAVAALATPLDVLRTRTLQILLADNEERIQDGAPSEAAAADPTGIKRAAAELAEAARRDGTAVLRRHRAARAVERLRRRRDDAAAERRVRVGARRRHPAALRQRGGGG